MFLLGQQPSPSVLHTGGYKQNISVMEKEV